MNGIFNSIVDLMGSFQQAIRKRWLLYLTLAAFLSLAFCTRNTVLHGNNVAQSKRSSLVDGALRNFEKNGAVQLPPKFGWLPSYASECRSARPRIPHDKCLHLVIEGESLTSASRDVNRIARVIQTINPERAEHELNGVYVVLYPAVREATYSGGITPYSISNHFKTGLPLIVKIGE